MIVVKHLEILVLARGLLDRRRVRSSRPSSVDANSSVSLRFINDMRELWRRSSTHPEEGGSYPEPYGARSNVEISNW